MNIFTPDNKKRRAYTLMEVTAVVVILGILAAIAIPNLGIVIERMRANEQIPILMAAYKAQKDKYLEEGKYSSVLWSNTSVYDLAYNFQRGIVQYLEFDFNNTNFTQPFMGCGTQSGATCVNAIGPHQIACSASGSGPGEQGWLARVIRNSATYSNYRLYVLEDGRIICHVPSVGCGGICSKLGFPDSI